MFRYRQRTEGGQMPEELIERLISFETAKLAKEKGFDPENKLYSIVDIKINGVFPTQALVQKWLREKFNLVVEVEGINWAFDKSFIKYGPSVFKIIIFRCRMRHTIIRRNTIRYPVASDLDPTIMQSNGLMMLDSAAPDRASFLKLPDLGRRLSPESYLDWPCRPCHR